MAANYPRSVQPHVAVGAVFATGQLLRGLLASPLWYVARNSSAAPTLEMVAERAGVSRATVSRVVNGSPKVHPHSADAVRAAIADLGYVPNRAARTLASQQSHAIALVAPEDITRFFGDVYFASIVSGIHGRLEQSDYVLNLMVASPDPSAKMLRYLAGGAVDGLVVYFRSCSAVAQR